MLSCTIRECVLARSRALAGGQGVLESGQRPGQLTPALQVHHGIQVIRDGIPGICDELGEAGIHFLLHLIVSARKWPW